MKKVLRKGFQCVVPPLLAVSLVVSQGACTRKEDSAGAPLRVQLASEPVSLDPAIAEDGIALQILSNTMDGLVGYDPSGNLESRLAESYTVSPDCKRYDFVLRADAKWSDGKPVRAQDFVYGILRALNPATGSKVAALLFPIRGAQAYRTGKGPADAVGVTASEDGRRVSFELEHPAPYFLGALTVFVAAPVREDLVASANGKWNEKNPVTGPYRIVDHVTEQKIVLERNPAYSRAGAAPAGKGFDRVELLVIRDESTGANLFQQGKTDILQRIPAYEFASFKKQGLVITSPFFATYYVAFNTRKPPFDQKHWRRAVAGVIHKQEIVDALGTGEGPARSWVPTQIEGGKAYVEDPAVYQDSIDYVKKHPLSPNAKSVAAAFDMSARNAMVMEKIQQDVQKELGLQLSLSNMDWRSYVKSIQTDAAPIYRFGWLAPFHDPISYLKVFVSSSENNYTGWKNAEYDALVREIDAMPLGPAREKKIGEAQKILMEREAVVVPIYHYVMNHIVSKRVGNFRSNPFGVTQFVTLTREDGAEKK